MRQSVSSLFSAADRERIAAAVHQAESKTSGEIVPYVVGRSDAYEEADWRCGALLGTATLAAFSIAYSYTSIWLPLSVAELVLAALLAGAFGVILPKFVPPLKRLFTGNHLMEQRVAQRAAEAFLSEEVFRTRERTGILVFLSILEHKVLVLGDSGINAKVKPEEWHDIVTRIVSGIGSGKPAEGLIDGILQCGVLLEQRGVAIRPEDTDELSDSLRTNDN
jgi:putative membrane protein